MSWNTRSNTPRTPRRNRSVSPPAPKARSTRKTSARSTTRFRAKPCCAQAYFPTRKRRRYSCPNKAISAKNPLPKNRALQARRREPKTKSLRNAEASARRSPMRGAHSRPFSPSGAGFRNSKRARKNRGFCRARSQGRLAEYSPNRRKRRPTQRIRPFAYPPISCAQLRSRQGRKPSRKPISPRPCRRLKRRSRAPP